jgi:N-carbamoyl-L-amino-acid hydrolase
VTDDYEVLQTVRDAGLRLPVHLRAIDFTEEEGTHVGGLGSRAFAGLLRPEHLKDPPCGRARLEADLERAGLSEAGLLLPGADPADLAGYLELHVEQGPRLLDAGAHIGVVTSIVGIRSYRVVFAGRADHAGTMSMAGRRDAALGAAAFTLAARELVMRDFPNCVANVGRARLEPGAYNIVPEKATLGLQFRSPDLAEFDRLRDALLAQARADAERFGLDFEAELLDEHEPAPMQAQARAAIAGAAERLGLRQIPLASGAGHDGQSLAHVTRAGMFFVPSVGGASHSPREFTEWGDCVRGANVLLHAALGLAEAKED